MYEIQETRKLKYFSIYIVINRALKAVHGVYDLNHLIY